jgi:hypothetical protein
VVGGPLGVGARGAAEEPSLRLVAEGRRLPDLPGVPAIKASTNGSGNPSWKLPCLAVSGGISW